MELTKHQLTIKAKMKLWYGDTKQHTLLSKLSQLKHELKLTSESIRSRKKLTICNSISSIFQRNQKQIFWNLKSEKITVEKEPTKDEIERFWFGIWNKPTTYNKDAQWLNTLEKEYCKGATGLHHGLQYVRKCYL